MASGISKIRQRMLELCWKIEELPASELQTEISVKASEIKDELDAIQKQGETPLLPCPFCGGSDLTTTTKPTWAEWRGFITCDTCGAMGPGVSSDVSGAEAEALAVVMWNRRGNER